MYKERAVTKVAGIKRARTRQFRVNYVRLRDATDSREESSASVALKTSPRAEDDLSEGGEIYSKR